MLFSCLSKREKLEALLLFGYGEWNSGPLKNVIIIANTAQLCFAVGSIGTDASAENSIA